MQAIIAVGGEGPKKLPTSFFENAKIFAADSGADLLSSYGIIPHVLLGDMDSVTLLGKSRALKVVTFPKTKDESDTELAFQAARKEGFRSWTVLGGGCGRFDHLLQLQFLAGRYPEWRLWLQNQDVVYFLRAGESLSGKGTRGMRLSVFPFLFSACRCKSTGLKWELDQVDFKSRVSLSNELSDNEWSVTCTTGLFFLVRPLEDWVEYSF